MRMARLQTGGGVGEPLVLSTIEEKIMSILGGESFAIGDRELEINPFHVIMFYDHFKFIWNCS